jgi:hypothetical protein
VRQAEKSERKERRERRRERGVFEEKRLQTTSVDKRETLRMRERQ